MTNQVKFEELDKQERKKRWFDGSIDVGFLQAHAMAGCIERDFSLLRLTLDGMDAGDWSVTVKCLRQPL